LEHAKKADDHLRTFEESVRTLKEREKGIAKVSESTKRQLP